ncbi:MAG: hypothetical protein HYZ53_04655 [Planctomycetes bacterium]|nr:hypothetical protein [Planctomycetota bacterium]
MPSQADLVFGRIAVQNRLITDAQLQETLQVQDSEGLAGEPRQLGEILQAKGYLTAAHVSEILRLQQILAIREEDKKFGSLCVRNGFLSEAALKEALELQKISVRGGGVPRRLGDILLEKGWITEQQRRAVITAQQRITSAVPSQSVPPPLPTPAPAAAPAAPPGFGGPSLESASAANNLFPSSPASAMFDPSLLSAPSPAQTVAEVAPAPAAPSPSGLDAFLGGGVVCSSCSTLNPSTTSTCENCHAPLAAFASGPSHAPAPSPAFGTPPGGAHDFGADAVGAGGAFGSLDLSVLPSPAPSPAKDMGAFSSGAVVCTACSTLNSPGATTCESCQAPLGGGADAHAAQPSARASAPSGGNAGGSSRSAPSHPAAPPPRTTRLPTEMLPADPHAHAQAGGGASGGMTAEGTLIQGICPLCHQAVPTPSPSCPGCGGRICPQCHRVAPPGIICAQCGFNWPELEVERSAKQFHWKDPRFLAVAGALLLGLASLPFVLGGGPKPPVPGPVQPEVQPGPPPAPDDSAGAAPPSCSEKWVVVPRSGPRHEGPVEAEADALAISEKGGKVSVPKADVDYLEAPGARSSDPKTPVAPAPLPATTPPGGGTDPAAGGGETPPDPGANPGGATGQTPEAAPPTAGAAVDLLAGLVSDPTQPPPFIDRTVTVLMKDGRSLQGELTDKGDTWEIKLKTARASVNKTVIRKADVAQIPKTPDLEYEERALALRKPKDPIGHALLAKWCIAGNLLDKAAYEYRMTVVEDPANQDAHRALGHPLLDGQFVAPWDLVSAAGRLLAEDKPEPAIAKLAPLVASRDKNLRRVDRFLALDATAKAYLKLGKLSDAGKTYEAMQELAEPGQKEILRARKKKIEECMKAGKKGAIELTAAQLAGAEQLEDGKPPLKPGWYPLVDERVMNLAVRGEALRLAADAKSKIADAVAKEADGEPALKLYEEVMDLASRASCLAADAGNDAIAGCAKQFLPFLLTLAGKYAEEADTDCPAKTPPAPGEKGKYAREVVTEWNKNLQAFLGKADRAEQTFRKAKALQERYPDALGDKAELLKETTRKVNEVLAADRKLANDLRSKIH